ncbi:hypothetical protein FRC04_007009 [Tulasnella sp. 424]|nr:hypothetical protein FRC04_007009 [Tulasnella sp. 424]
MSSTPMTTTPTELNTPTWYWILIVGGQILLPFLLATMILSRNVRRDPTLVNMIISWIIFTVVLCMLYYAGDQSGAEPPFGVCLAQASMLAGAPVILINRKRSWLFCSIDGPMVIAVSVVSAVLSGITVLLEGWIALLFYRHGTQIASTKTESAFNVRIILRVIAFSLYSGFCWVSFIIFGTKWDVVPWMLTATVPLVAFVIFGSQKSVLRVWTFWIPRKPREELQPPSPLTPSANSYDPRKPFAALSTAKFTAFRGSKGILVALPPQAHLPLANDDRKLALTQSREGSLDGHKGLVDLTRSTSETGSVSSSPSSPGDEYGWEKGYKKTVGLVR